jgi:hypothetical protein
MALTPRPRAPLWAAALTLGACASASERPMPPMLAPPLPSPGDEDVQAPMPAAAGDAVASSSAAAPPLDPPTPADLPPRPAPLQPPSPASGDE